LSGPGEFSELAPPLVSSASTSSCSPYHLYGQPEFSGRTARTLCIDAAYCAKTAEPWWAGLEGRLAVRVEGITY